MTVSIKKQAIKKDTQFVTCTQQFYLKLTSLACVTRKIDLYFMKLTFYNKLRYRCFVYKDVYKLSLLRFKQCLQGFNVYIKFSKFMATLYNLPFFKYCMLHFSKHFIRITRQLQMAY